MNKSFIVSDTHFSHANLLVGTTLWEDKSGCRDFQTVEEHDSTILDNINSLVMPDDTLYFLGDFVVGSMSSIKMKKPEACIHYRNKINCKNIICIRGNHDLSKKQLRGLGIFSEVHDRYELHYKKNLIIMDHYPLASWREMSHGSIACFGHCHSKRINGRSMDIGLDGNNFKPRLLDDVVDFLNSQPILTEGHHK